MKLLWTERPKLLDRELETHEWMEKERPWERFKLELVYDNQPGGWVRFSNVFADLWERCGRERDGFINVESDVVPTLAAFEAVLACPHPVCLVPFRWNKDNWWGAWIEERVPGGWRTRTATEADEWAMEGDTGFVRFRPGVCGRPLLPSVRLTKPNGIMYTEVYKSVGRRVHLHWPGLKNNHSFWDEGDFEHWPRSEWDRLRRERAGILHPRLAASAGDAASPSG